MVFVNYGRVEDFEELSATLVDVTGCIAIARYGKIFRGSKVTFGGMLEVLQKCKIPKIIDTYNH